MTPRRRGLRQAALLLFGLTAAWVLIVVATGGFVFHVGAIRISARRALNPGIAALAAAAAAWALATGDERRRAIAAARAHLVGDRGVLRLVRHRPHQLAPMIVLAAVISVVTFGLVKGTFVAAAADAYGYVSQADLWAKGSLIVRQPFAQDMTWPNAADALAPLGYRPHRPAPHGTDIVPIYSPGVPMLMAVFKLLAGAKAVYVVVPLLGGLAVWVTFVMGRRLAGPLAGASAAVLLATSPPFLFEVTAPASDVAATAWWALTFTWLLFERPLAAFGAGVAAGFAILTRPNLVPLAIVPGVLLLWRAARAQLEAARRDRKPLLPRSPAGDAAKRVLAFAAGSVPACVVVAIINWRLYGSPLASGYGAFDELYSWAYLWPNLARYPRWLFETETPLVLLALIAPFVLPLEAEVGRERRPRATAVAWLCVIAVIFLLYLFYQPFDEWWYLRFILPVYPLLFVLTSTAIARLLAPLSRLAGSLKGLATVAVVAFLAWHGAVYAVDRGASIAWQAEQRYVEVGAYVGAKLPARAALVCMQHSGSARYYSGRITVRYDLIAPEDLDLVIEELRRLGYHPYVVLDDWEEPIFRERFRGHSALAGLDWTPVAVIHSNHVRIYDPADQQGARLDRQRVPDVVR